MSSNDTRRTVALYARVSTLDQDCNLQLADTEGIDTTTPAGQLLFHVVGAVAQFERDLIVQRVRAGMAHARALGKQIGRPRAIIDADKVAGLRMQGYSLRAITTQLDVPVSRVRRALKQVEVRDSE